MTNKVRLQRFGIVSSYALFYFICFYFLEQRNVPVHIIHTTIDENIPFCEYFVIPYFLWFVFVAATMVYFIFFNRSELEYRRITVSLIVGMSVFLLISYIYPNGQDLRPAFTGDNIFGQMVAHLYQTDTPTNILPSLHVYNSVACCIAITNNQACRKNKFILTGTWLLTISIVLSTMFLKQHSIIDVLMALAANAVAGQLCYGKSTIILHSNHKRHNQDDSFTTE